MSPRAPGGHGAAREFCDLLLMASGRYAALLHGDTRHRWTRAEPWPCELHLPDLPEVPMPLGPVPPRALPPRAPLPWHRACANCWPPTCRCC